MIFEQPYYMAFKNIQFIINPASGKEEPILSHIYNVLHETDINWEVTVPKCEEDTFSAAEKFVGKTDLVVIYGGDGSITQVARALQGKETPMAIIPGGTANVVSKELGIPQDSLDALKLITNDDARIIKMDTGQANKRPFLLRINLGIMADMILDANQKLKSAIGQAAYGISALKALTTTKPIHFKLVIDGEEIEEEGVSLTVTNAGNIGIGDMSFLPGISVTDGYLDVILMHDASWTSVLQVAGTTLFQKDSDVLKHWRCKEILIKTDQLQKYICDDCDEEADQIDIKINELALNVLVPAQKE